MTPDQGSTSPQLQTSNSRTMSNSPINSSLACDIPWPECSRTLSKALPSKLCLPPPKLSLRIPTATAKQSTDKMQVSSYVDSNTQPCTPSPSPPCQSPLSPLSELTPSPSRLNSSSLPTSTPSPPSMTAPSSPDDSSGTEKSLITPTPCSPQIPPKSSSESDSTKNSRTSMSESRAFSHEEKR